MSDLGLDRRSRGGDHPIPGWTIRRWKRRLLHLRFVGSLGSGKDLAAPPPAPAQPRLFGCGSGAHPWASGPQDRTSARPPRSRFRSWLGWSLCCVGPGGVNFQAPRPGGCRRSGPGAHAAPCVLGWSSKGSPTFDGRCRAATQHWAIQRDRGSPRSGRCRRKTMPRRG